jgi:hypothetical protein
MIIKIETEKVLLDSIAGPARKILKVRALKREEVPPEYVEGDYWCYLSEDGNAIFGEDFTLTVGTVISEEVFQRILGDLRECGNRLREINRSRRELAEVWKGTETFEI